VNVDSADTAPLHGWSLKQVSRAEVELLGLLRAGAGWAGIGRLVERTLCDVLGRFQPEGPGFEVAVEGEMPACCELLPGVHGARLVQALDGGALIDGWPLPVAVPVLCLDGDVVTADGHRAVIRYDRPLLPFLQVGVLRPTGTPGNVAYGFGICIPLDYQIPVVLDGSATAAALDAVLGPDPDRVFGPAMLGEVELAVMDTIASRVVSAFAQLACGESGSMQVALPADYGRVGWLAGSLRIGPAGGTIAIGLDRGSALALADGLRHRAQPRQLGPLAHATVCASLELHIGRYPAVEVAGLCSGDCLLAHQHRAFADGVVIGSMVIPSTGAARATAWTCSATVRGPTLDVRVCHKSAGDEVRNVGSNTEAEDAVTMVEAISLEVSVEVAHRDFTVGQLAGLTAGDVLEMNAPLDGVVRLLANGQPLGYARLVDIEGSLGVQIIAIGGRP
jgi:flagellar motor switch/type III secretory pathway protein FliN